MKLSEVLKVSKEEIQAKIGPDPYLYYDFEGSGKIYVSSLEYIKSLFVRNGEPVIDIELFAYGYKKDENDKLQYINPDDLDRRFEEMNKANIYEMIEEDNTISYGDLDLLMYYDENGIEVIANCKPSKQIIQEEIQRRIEISDGIRRR